MSENNIKVNRESHTNLSKINEETAPTNLSDSTESIFCPQNLLIEFYLFQTLLKIYQCKQRILRSHLKFNICKAYNILWRIKNHLIYSQIQSSDDPQEATRRSYWDQSLKTYNLLKSNAYLDRKRRVVTEDDIFVCECLKAKPAEAL